MRFEVGDLIRIAAHHPLASYTGQVVAVEKDYEACMVRMNHTGLIRSFPVTEIELIGRPEAQSSNLN